MSTLKKRICGFSKNKVGFSASINEINNRKATAQRSREDIKKLNLQQWTTLEQSVKIETENWKNSLVRNDWCNIGPYWKLDKLGLPRQIQKVEQPIWVAKQKKNFGIPQQTRKKHCANRRPKLRI